MCWNRAGRHSCSKSILFLDCDAWKDIRTERLIDILPLQNKTVSSPRLIQIVDHTRAIWMQHILDQLELIRSQLGGVVEKYRIYVIYHIKVMLAS